MNKHRVGDLSMRLVFVKHCEPGRRLAKSIYNEHGVTLLNINAELSQAILDRLLAQGIEYIYVHDPLTEDVVIEDPLSDETRRRAIVGIRTSFETLMNDNLTGSQVRHNHFIGKDFRNIVEMILEDISENKNAMMMLSTISITDFYLFQHSLNVSIYTTMLGMASGLPKEELLLLGMGAMLHDIGKTKIPLSILNKPGPLTQSEMLKMKEHTTIGFQLLKDEPNIPLLVAHCALQHHERLNGSGYPRQLIDEDIHEYAKWIGLVDAYDAMTSRRVYKKAMLPHQAVELLYTQAGTLYDREKIEAFRNRFALYPLGVTVEMHTGEVGIVVDINSSSPQRPIVRIIRDADGQDVSQPYEIDMSKQLNAMIVKVNDVKVQL